MGPQAHRDSRWARRAVAAIALMTALPAGAVERMSHRFQARGLAAASGRQANGWLCSRMNAAQVAEELSELLAGEEPRKALFVLEHLFTQLVQKILPAGCEENALAAAAPG